MTASTKPILAKAADYSQKVSGWMILAPGEAVRWAGGLKPSTLAWSSLALAALLLLSFNLASSILFRNVKADLTEDRLFTISDGTKAVLSKIEEPISIRVYYTKQLGILEPTFGKYFERVKALLEQYRDLSNGKVQVTFLEPEPFSDAEDRATAAGLRGIRLNQDGETGYFGLAASNTTDNDAVIPFFSPDRERFLEYDMTKLVNGLANPKKRVVGLITDLPLDGGAPNPMSPMRQPTPPWAVMEQIREFFTVKTLPHDLKTIPADVDVLMIAQPLLLSKDAAYAVDQYALSGGPVLAFVDPFTETSPPPGPPGMPIPLSKEAGALLKSWGLQFDENKVVGDPTLARRVQFGGRGRPTVTEYLAWLQIDKPQINAKDPLAASIERLNMASVGALAKAEGATTTIQPIVETTDKAAFIDADKIRMQPDPIAIMRSFKPGTKPLILAARVSGEAKSAYPDGRPKTDEKPKDGEAKDAKSEPAKAEPSQAGTAKTEPEKAHVTSGKVNIVVVADADILNDQFWVEIRDFLGQQIQTPLAHNAAFVVNALENLSGGAALAGLRGRGISERPFDRVLAIRRDAERNFRQKEETLVAKLKDLQEKLSKIETKGGDGGAPAIAILTDKDKQAIETFRTEMTDVRRELRTVKSDLRRDIDRLNWWLQFFNVAFVPLVIGIGGLAVGLSNRRRKLNGT